MSKDMTICEAMKVLGYDPTDHFFRSEIKSIHRRLIEERENVHGTMKRRNTRKLQACDVILHSRYLWGVKALED